MTGPAFVLRGLWFFRASYAGMLAAVALGAMVLLGALLAGDSVKASLLHLAQARLGKVDAVLTGGDRMFRAALADDLAAGEAPAEAAPVMLVQATVSVPRSGRTLAAVQVLGVDRRFWRFQPGPAGDAASAGGVAPNDRGFEVNETVARSLNLTANETLVLRFEKPGRVAGDAPLAGQTAELIALRGDVKHIRGEAEFGRFSLQVSQLPQPTVFMPLDRLQQALGLEGKANLLLLHHRQGWSEDQWRHAVTRHCTLEDYGLIVDEVPLAAAIEISSARIFIDRPLAAAIQQRFPATQPVITYLANTLAIRGRQTPYSMVTAVDPAAAPFLTGQANGAVLNAWEADDLEARVGDEVRIDYYALDGANRLVERSGHLPVAAVVPFTGLAADPQWMPDFPGVAEAEKTSDWDPGVPLELKRIRPKDDAYWKAHRGTPKLFLPLAIGREWFGNRWGEATALRLPAAGTTCQATAQKLLEAVSPATAGLVLQEVARHGRAKSESAVDFAGMLLGMSLFLMVAAVAITAMLFRFHIDQRNHESGLLAALGVPPQRILRWRLLEGLVVVTAGCALGTLLAAGYTRMLLGWLEPIWRGPDDPPMFHFHATPTTVMAGCLAFTALMMLAIGWVTHRQGRRGINLRLAAGTEEVIRPRPQPVPWWAAGWAMAGACVLAGQHLLGSQGAFFLAGVAWLLAGLAAYRWLLARRVATGGGELSPRRLATLNCARRPARSLLVVGTLACGVFLVVAVAAFRQHDSGHWRERDSGTGGFAFWLETTRPPRRATSPGDATHLLELADDRRHFGQILPVRAGPGDDASCFNLNQVARPRLLAADAAAIARRGAFPIRQVSAGCAKNWNTLREGGVMRAFVDESTLRWVLKKSLGEQLIYQDEWGRPFPVELAGTLDASVFQGCMVVDEARFLQHYPSADGPRIFLLECATDLAAGRDILQQALADYGVRVSTTHGRLAAFHEVENTYITIFQLLGGLGVILGSAGLGLVTARNLRDRQHEFAILHALGVPAVVTRRVLWFEVASLIRWGIALGGFAAVIAILPALASSGISGSIRGWLWIAALLLLASAHSCGWAWLVLRRQPHQSAVPFADPK